MDAIHEHGIERRRMTEASFDVAVEVRGVGCFIEHERVSEAVNKLLAGREPRGRRVGKWPNLCTG